MRSQLGLLFATSSKNSSSTMVSKTPDLALFYDNLDSVNFASAAQYATNGDERAEQQQQKANLANDDDAAKVKSTSQGNFGCSKSFLCCLAGSSVMLPRPSEDDANASDRERTVHQERSAIRLKLLEDLLPYVEITSVITSHEVKFFKRMPNVCAYYAFPSKVRSGELISVL